MRETGTSSVGKNTGTKPEEEKVPGTAQRVKTGRIFETKTLKMVLVRGHKRALWGQL